METDKSTPGDEEKPQVVSARQARGGTMNSRVVTVLIASLALAAIVMFVFLKVDWQ